MRGRQGDVIGRQADFSSLGLGVSQVQSSQRVRPVPAGVFPRLSLGPQELLLACTESPTLVNRSVQKAASFLKHLI